MEDSKIIDLYWQRSESAITETSKKYSRLLVSIALNILGNYSDAEECENDTYLEEDEEFFEEDENVQMLIAIKSIVDPKKAIFLDRVIEAYNKGFFK